MDGSVLVVLAVYQSNLVSSENDDVTSGSMNTTLAVKELTFFLSDHSDRSDSCNHMETYLLRFYA